MFNNLCVRKRALSIYSILTIIVLISISEVCASGLDIRISKEYDASVLVTADGFSHTPEKLAYKYLDIKRSWNRILVCVGQKIKIDGGEEIAWTLPYGGHKNYLEISPGPHIVDTTFELTEQALSVGQNTFSHTFKISNHIELTIESNSMYVFMNIINGSGFKITSTLEKAPHRYDQKSGYATHPTDSTLSFKVK